MSSTGTIDGYAPDPEETAAILAEEIDVEDLADPTLLYVRASQLQARYAALAAEATRLRREAIQRLHDGGKGMSLQAIADHLGISKPRAQQLAKHDD